MEPKININDLINGLNEQNHQQTQFQAQVNRDQRKKVAHISKKQQLHLKRQSQYQHVKENMDRWVPIIKVNRQKQTLNFVNKDHDQVNVNFFPHQSVNQFHQRINSHLQKMNLQSQKALKEQEQQILKNMKEEEAQSRLMEARKHRMTIFKQQQKRRKMNKIKSKAYRKIKKRQKLREEDKKVEEMEGEQRAEYYENIMKKRIEERINLRHKNKSKYVQKLMRFNKNDRKGVQDSINELNQIRKKELEKVDPQLIDEISQEYDEQNFDRQQTIKELEAHIQEIQKSDNQQQLVAGDLNFRKKAQNQRKLQAKSEAQSLLKKLQSNEMESQEQENVENNKDEVELNRKVFGQNLQESKGISRHNQGIQKKQKQYLSNDGQLTEGISLTKLKDKYNPQRVNIDLSALISENKEIYHQNNEAILENIRQYNMEKANQYQKQIQAESKNQNKVKGWGNWTGPGIKERKPDEKEELRRKLKKIEEIKNKRKDGLMANVSINQSTNRQLSDYMVRELPHGYSNPQQFDYLQNMEIGPEWNSLNQFKDNIKPKVINKVGQVINSVKLPKSLNK